MDCVNFFVVTKIDLAKFFLVNILVIVVYYTSSNLSSPLYWLSESFGELLSRPFWKLQIQMHQLSPRLSHSTALNTDRQTDTDG